jgi:hypothetical protein
MVPWLWAKPTLLLLNLASATNLNYKKVGAFSLPKQLLSWQYLWLFDNSLLCLSLEHG